MQPGECSVVAQVLNRRIDGGAKIRTVLCEGDPELLMGRHLHRDGQLRSVLDQPGDHREKLDNDPDTSGLKIVERCAIPWYG